MQYVHKIKYEKEIWNREPVLEHNFTRWIVCCQLIGPVQMPVLIFYLMMLKPLCIYFFY